jgi:prolyl 4-hydroxylase
VNWKVMRLTQRIENVTAIPQGNYENFQVLRYNVGQFYRTHHDMSSSDNQLACGPRILTFFLYLSDVEEGGGTNFPRLDLTVQPKRGSAVLWPSVLNEDPTRQDPRTFHQALPVVKGAKFAANAWIHLYDYKMPNLWGCTGAFG